MNIRVLASRHPLRIKNASVHEMLFIHYALFIGEEFALEAFSDRMHFLNRPVEEYLDAVQKIRNYYLREESALSYPHEAEGHNDGARPNSSRETSTERGESCG
jgi:hypothetical protein